MAIVLATVAIIVGAVLLLAFVFGRSGQALSEQIQHDRELAEPDVDTLDYEVPEGQDPAVVTTALSVNGLEAAADHVSGRQLVHIACSPADTLAREQARGVIEGIGTTSLDAGAPMDPRRVHFVDER